MSFNTLDISARFLSIIFLAKNGMNRLHVFGLIQFIFTGNKTFMAYQTLIRTEVYVGPFLKTTTKAQVSGALGVLYSLASLKCHEEFTARIRQIYERPYPPN